MAVGFHRGIKVTTNCFTASPTNASKLQGRVNLRNGNSLPPPCARLPEPARPKLDDYSVGILCVHEGKASLCNRYSISSSYNDGERKLSANDSKVFSSKPLVAFGLSAALLIGICQPPFSPCANALTQSAPTLLKNNAFDPVPQEEKNESKALSLKIDRAIQLLEDGRIAQANGDFFTALAFFDEIVSEYGDFALSDYARLGKAIVSYEIGDRRDAIILLEELSIEFKGYPEVHAALAAAMYNDKHALQVAEKQFTIATLLDKRYANINWIEENKSWPPSLLKSMDKLIKLE